VIFDPFQVFGGAILRGISKTVISPKLGEIYGKYGNLWEIYWKYMGNILEIYWKYMGSMLDIYGKYMGNIYIYIHMIIYIYICVCKATLGESPLLIPVTVRSL